MYINGPCVYEAPGLVVVSDGGSSMCSHDINYDVVFHHLLQM